MLGLNTTYLGVSITQGGPGVCEAVRETFHERELFPRYGVGAPTEIVADRHPDAFYPTNLGYLDAAGGNMVTASYHNIGTYLVNVADIATNLRAIADG